jgi:predicted nuclease of restriction endonuclease-like (RecB) superfamily
MADEITKSFARIAGIIETARENTFQKVNEELIRMYWNVGEFLSGESQSASFGDSYIDSVADFIQQEFPGIRGFTRRGLYRMKRFYEIYKDDEFVTTLLTQVSWSNHLAIISKAKTEEERHFYLMLSIKERYTARELQRQIDSAYYERYMLSKDKIKPETVVKEGTVPFLDTYVLDFLTLPKNYKEKDLKKAILNNLKDFILEVGRDFTFIDEEYKVEVGNRDFFIDLLFFHRGLSCLVAFELKIGQFEPEYVSKMDFYLEALDRQCRKENENPSVGVILCALKDDEVVEYSLSRTLSPTMVSEYTLQLPDKKILRKKLRELSEIAEIRMNE